VAAELTIEELAAGGDGVGHVDGKVVFVPRTAPGDVVEVELTEEKKSFARGQVVRISEPSTARRDPGCDYFARGRCGGCQWLHVEAATQHRAKLELVIRALRHAIDRGLEISALETPAPPLGWRRRARLSWFRPRKRDRAIVGFLEPRGHRVADVERCPQLSPNLEAALGAIRAALAPGLHKRGEIDLLEGAGGEVICAVRGPCNRAALADLAADPAIAGVRASRASLGLEVVALEGGIEARAGDFTQSSAAGNLALRAAVRRWLGSPGRALELYAGGGNLTGVIAEAGGEVLAVDRSAGPRLAGERITWRRGAVDEVSAALAAAGERFDLVVIDPPRTGAREVVESVAQMTDRVIYVSCDPATLGRDLDAFAERGLIATRARPIDLMPQTYHVEVVCELVRR
jgi:23S rRNA (uracil1939-C5)-methyltransferase